MVASGLSVTATESAVATPAGARSLVADPHFILATRDTGYRSLASAVAELIDNAIQAKAGVVQVFVREEVTADAESLRERDVTIAVLDDGEGMDSASLWTALQFGGTGRFGDRSGLGRFGMGLPNSSVSQSRRFEVYSWRRTDVLFSYLDVDEVARRELREVPAPSTRALPHWAQPLAGPTGTLVVWNRCDRLNFRRASTIAQKLHIPIGRMYRHLIWSRVRISINGQAVAPIDPLFCHPVTPEGGASSYGEPLTYEIAVPGAGRGSTVRARFTELPVAAWRALAVEDKRHRGIVGGAGILIVRAGREIDYAWHLMGTKRKENYDDWWRCEVSFDPMLDEFFGVTHSKQGVAPTPQLQAILSPDLEAAARTLNRRVRDSFELMKESTPSRATTQATRQEVLLPPLPTEGARLIHWPVVCRTRSRPPSCAGRAFFDVIQVDGRLIVTINADHPFFGRIYAPALAAKDDRGLYDLECLVPSRSARRTRDRASSGAEIRPATSSLLGETHLVAFLERRV